MSRTLKIIIGIVAAIIIVSILWRLIKWVVLIIILGLVIAYLIKRFKN